MKEEIREIEVLHQRFIGRPLNYVISIFERQNTKMKKHTRIFNEKLEIVFTSTDMKWRRTKEGREIGLLRYVFLMDSLQSTFLEIRREWVLVE